MGKFVVMPPPGVEAETNTDGTPVYKDIRHATHWHVFNKLTGESADYVATEDEANRLAADLNQD